MEVRYSVTYWYQGNNHCITVYILVFDRATFFAQRNMGLAVSSIFHSTKPVRSIGWFFKNGVINCDNWAFVQIDIFFQFLSKTFKQFTVSKKGRPVIWQITIWFNLPVYTSAMIVSLFFFQTVRKILIPNYVNSLNGM